MNKFFALLITCVVAFTVCEQPTDNNPGVKLPSLTIRNESSYVLTDVKFSGISFAAPDSNDLPTSNQSVKQLTADDLNKTGYITFTRKDIGIALRTEAISIADEDYPFTFTNNTPVEEVANTGNKNTLSQISFLSKVTVEHGTLPVAKNQNLNFGETVTNRSNQFNFTLKNTGVGKLLLTAGGTEPVRISGEGADAFSVIQPSSSEIAPDGSLPFKISFNPTAAQEYTAVVTIISNDKDGDFTFNITATGVLPKPVAEVYFSNNAVSQNGTIDAGEVIITHSKNITVEIRNTGTEVLTLDTADITITGADAAVFSKLTNPGGSISENGQSSFIIKCEPTEQGENNATLTIPTNDSSRNPVIILLQMTAIKGSAVLELSQAGTAIANNSLTPFDFGQIELTTNKPLAFTIKNKGNIALELTGTPAVTSSNAVFAIQTQPANKTISPESEVSFLLQYAPTVEAEETASITIYNNSDDMVFTLNVKGTGYVKRPQITVRQETTTINQNGEFDFDSVFLSEQKDVIFTIVNSGEATLTFETVNNNRINLENNAENLFTVITQPSATATVAPESTTTFTVRFNPSSVGSIFSAIVKIKTNSQDNDEFSFTVKGNCSLAPPAGVTAVFQPPDSMLVSWNPVPGAASYKVYYGTSSSSITILADGAVTGTSYTHTGLSVGTRYYYCITAQDDMGESERSQPVSMVTLPGIPANLRSTASTQSSITVAWDAVTGAASYKLYFATSDTGNKTLVDTVSSGTSYTHTGLSVNTTNYYFVTAVNGAGEGAYTGALSARTLMAPLSPPNNVTATALSTNSIQLTWGAVAGAVSYKVYRTTSATGTRTLLDTVTTTSFTSGGLEARTYWYFVTALNADNIESAESASASMIPKPNIPSNVDASGASGSVAVRVSWSDVPGVESYRIYYATSPTGTKTLAGTKSSGEWTVYYHEGTANTTYYYWVTAVNAAGESGYSLQTSALTPPAAPMNLRATSVTTTTITLAWNAVAGASYYYIEGVSSPTQTGTSCVISGHSPQTWYLYSVRAYNSAGVYGPEAVISVQTK